MAKLSKTQKMLRTADEQAKRPMIIHRDCQGIDSVMGLAELVALITDADQKLALVPVKYAGQTATVISAVVENDKGVVAFRPLAMLIAPEMAACFEGPEGTYLGRSDGTRVEPATRPVTEVKPLSTGLYL